jgi:hypothetical protein
MQASKLSPRFLKPTFILQKDFGEKIRTPTLTDLFRESKLALRTSAKYGAA